MTYKEILNLIETNQPFAFSRWGDGEWYNVNKIKGQNCDGNIYYEDLGNELKKIVSETQDYYMGVQTLIEYSLTESKKYPQKWIDSDIFHRASMDYELNKLIDILHQKHVVYIGNTFLGKLDFINEFIEIPLNNSWLDKDNILSKIGKTITNKHKVYLFSCGMATNYYVDVLWKKNNNQTYIDVGSVFDPIVGRTTRSYHKNLKL